MPDHDKEGQEVGMPWTLPIIYHRQIWVDIIYTVELFGIFLATPGTVLSSFVVRITTVIGKTYCYCFFYTGNGLPLDF